MMNTIHSLLLALLAAILLQPSSAMALSFEQKVQQLGNFNFAADVDYLTRYQKECRTITRFRRTKRMLAEFGKARTVGSVFELKKFMESSRWNRLCANVLLRDQDLLELTLAVFEAAGCETNTKWGRAKCYNTGSCPATHAKSWSAAHADARAKQKTQCIEYQYESEDQWRASVR